jgi:hypothetical protein
LKNAKKAHRAFEKKPRKTPKSPVLDQGFLGKNFIFWPKITGQNRRVWAKNGCFWPNAPGDSWLIFGF